MSDLNTVIEINLSEYKALVASSLAGKRLVEWINENEDVDGCFDFMVKSSIDNVNQRFEDTGLIN